MKFLIVANQLFETFPRQRFKQPLDDREKYSFYVLNFDLTDMQSFTNIKRWLKELECYKSSPATCILVGTKSDHPNREVKGQIAKEFADSLGMPYIETSAKNGTNVEEIFVCGANLVLTQREQSKLESSTQLTPSPL